MKSILFTVLLICGSGFSFAQETDSLSNFGQNKHYVSVGYPLSQLTRLRSKTGMGPLHVKYEMALTQHLGIGGATYFHSEKAFHENPYILYSNGDPASYRTKVWGYGIMPKVNWHFITSNLENEKAHKWDLYVGLGIGYGFEYYSKTYARDYELNPQEEEVFANAEKKTHFVASEFNVGARFYPIEQLGAYCEVGFGASTVQFGLIYKW